MNKLSALGIAILAGLMFTPLGVPILVILVVYVLLASDDDDDNDKPDKQKDKKG